MATPGGARTHAGAAHGAPGRLAAAGRLGLAASLCALLAGCGVSAGASDRARHTGPGPVVTFAAMTAGHALPAGGRLRSPHGRSVAALRDGRIVVTRDARRVWSSPAAGHGATLRLSRAGTLQLLDVRGRVRWSDASRTLQPGTARLTLSDAGVLRVAAGALTAWDDVTGSRCAVRPRGTARRRLVVGLGRQHAWLCEGRTQLMSTAVTTGAGARGRATPVGRWHIQAITRDVTLHPAGGGAYFVHVWMPYDGAYGLHDAPWQRFPFGSARYRSAGSHGCVHLPGAVMRALVRALPVGSSVVVRP